VTLLPIKEPTIHGNPLIERIGCHHILSTDDLAATSSYPEGRARGNLNQLEAGQLQGHLWATNHQVRAMLIERVTVTHTDRERESGVAILKGGHI